jgi:ribosome-binding factor A
MAPSTRQQKYAKLIQKELSDIFLKDKRGILENAFITIADVRMSPDLGVAKVYISMLLAILFHRQTLSAIQEEEEFH